ncbi:GNAT family protein [Kosakonia sp. BK9b]|uniref:GNAT family N-acetyltransferase n=1 Tax=Kosakonia sp. TaxID=1916651 RepID=UPI0028A08980|nr:GNAT family protein [Kosakonia sp.]
MDKFNAYGQRLGQPLPEWAPRALPEKINLHGQYCNVIPLAIDHAEDLFPEWHSIEDDRDWTWLEDNRPKDKSACYAYLRDLIAHKDRLYFSVQDKSDDQIKGIFYIGKIDPDNGSFDMAEVNWTPLMKRTRVSTESLYLVLSYFFDTLKYRRCEWRTSTYNIEGIRAAERIGFVKEGILRDKKVRKGYSVDIAVFAITRKEWPAIVSMMTAWLREENFDGLGHQRQKLTAFRRY